MPTFDKLSATRDKTRTGVVQSKIVNGWIVDVGGVQRTIRSAVGNLESGAHVIVTETPQGMFVVAPGTTSGRKTLEVDIDG